MNRCPKPHPLAVCKVIEGYLVLSHIHNDELIILNGIGARVFLLADGNKTVAEIIRFIACEFHITMSEARQEVADCLQEMMILKLLIAETPPEFSSL
jgi:hypothetical protein